MITYDWNCKTVDVHPQEQGETDVVYNVHWIVTGTSDQLNPEGEPYAATSIGTQVVPLDESTPFVPFSDLTNDIVVGWTKDAMGEEQVQAIEAGIASQIEELINPTSVTMTIQ
tara:strand:+ start:1004 stop:1342 length:339 start_codon:yes stop_codon:yes gene_type:complete